MKSISLCMIVKNEEENLAKCMESVQRIVDEIIIVDTGSTDATKEIAAKYTSNIYDFKWCNDFSKARNTAFSKATKDYILWLDADDVLRPEDQKKMLQLKEELDETIDVVMLKYNIAFDKNGNPTFSYYRERLVKRSLNIQWREPVHEYLPLVGNVVKKDIAVTHEKTHSSGDRNINIYKEKIRKGEKLSTRGVYYYAKELYEHNRIKEAIKYFEGFLKKEDGWAEDKISACYYLSICYKKMEELEKQRNTLIKSFEYDIPRAEICCQLGAYYFQKKEYKKAIYWYTVAATLEFPEDNWGFRQIDCWTFLPNIQLCVCYDRIGDIEKAIKYNEIAAKFKPESESVLYNRTYFNNRQRKDI
ncbi:MAG: glycosyltransferase family 2 protein [bacterium]|nr:glycosyltransferase family 2 protein [bacterium]